MINFLDTINNYDDTWKMTFYFVFALALIIGIFWTLFQMSKYNKKNKTNQNTIYNKSEDVIENMDITPQRKKQEIINNENYYDVYQTEAKKEKYEMNIEKENALESANDIEDNNELENQIDKVKPATNNKKKTNLKNNYSKNKGKSN